MVENDILVDKQALIEAINQLRVEYYRRSHQQDVSKSLKKKNRVQVKLNRIMSKLKTYALALKDIEATEPVKVQTNVERLLETINKDVVG